jgi:glutamate/tyrosine decarboxylase-like PLP-dependent enzyme
VIPDVLRRAVDHAGAYLDHVADRPVNAMMSAADLRSALGSSLPKQGAADLEVIDALARAAGQGTVASRGPRYFGFVVGGSLPVATAADWLVSAWDQNCGLYALSPLVSVVEEIAVSWIREIVGLPASWSAGFVTGGVMANFTALAAARHHVLAAAGWDVEADGLFGAPAVTVVVSEEAHYTIASSLRLLGLGGERVHRVPADGQGRMRADALASALGKSRGPCIVCAQAGNVNTGAFDPLEEIATAARARNAWLHVDGAFGLWAAASPSLAPLVAGIAHADSIATDAHKWLNVPYDCGIVLCQHKQSHRRAMTVSAAYITENPAARDPREFVPEESRRARAVPVYAVLRALGRDGLRDLVERCCHLARRMAERLRSHHAVSILNDVVLNQVLVRVGASQAGADQRTQNVIARVQQDGTCWLGGTTWQGKVAMRVSISNWSTSEEDIDRSADAILRAVEETDASGNL